MVVRPMLVVYYSMCIMIMLVISDVRMEKLMLMCLSLQQAVSGDFCCKLHYHLL